MKEWSDKVVRKWLHNTAMDLIHDGLYQDGGHLEYYSKFYTKKISKEKLISILKEVLWWEEDEIEETLDEVRKLHLAAFI